MLSLIHSDFMDTDDVISFFGQLGVDLEDPVTLVVSCYFKAKRMGEYAKSEFVQGMVALSCDSLDKLRDKVPELRKELRTNLQEVYKFTFSFSLDPGCKSLALAPAVELWKILLGPLKSRLVGLWLEYLVEVKKPVSISKDTWNMFFLFEGATREQGLEGYNEEDAWPLLIDEFVAHLREK